MAPSLSWCRRPAGELDQLEAKGLDAVKRAVQSRLVQLAGQHGVLAVPLDLEISERLTAGVAKTT